MMADNSTYIQTLYEIRQDLSEAELSGISDEEYIALLSKHTTSLVNFVEQLSSEHSHQVGFEKVLHILFQDLSEPICVVDDEQQILFLNQEWKLFASRCELGKPVSHCFREKDKEAIEQSIHQAGKQGRRTVFTLRKGKMSRFISALPFTGFDGAVNYLLLAYSEEVVKNIRSSNGSSVGKEEQELATVKEAVLDMVDGFYFIMDYRLQLRFVSDKLEQKLGYLPETVLNRSIYTIMDKASVENFAVFFDTVVNAREIHLTARDMVFRTATNRRKTFELSLRMHPNGAQLIGLCKDIERHKVVEREMARARRDAEVNDRMKSHFLANMSHEIRTPLNGIVGFSTMLGQENIPADKREKYMRIVHSSTRHLLALVNDIIDISKIEAGQLHMVTTPVNVHTLLNDLHTTFISEARRMDKTHLNIIKQTPRPNEAFIIHSDETRLRQVLTNLMSNALKFTSQGSITFGYRLLENSKIRFSVRDTGAGMDKVETKTVFIRYKQTEEGRKGKYHGTGIGLAISKGIVQLLNGEIDVQSEPGVGSEFYFTLPLEAGIPKDSAH